MTKNAIIRKIGQIVLLEKSPEIYTHNFGWILCMTGLAKLLTLFGHSHVLQIHEPITQTSFSNLFLLAGISEFAAGTFCLIAKTPLYSALLVAWMLTGFLIYRGLLAWIGWTLPCPCLGDLVERLHISPVIGDIVMKCIFAYLLLASYLLLLKYWLIAKRTPNSGNHISVL